MIALNFIYELDELLYSIDVPDSGNSDLVYDFFDFDKHSFEDFIDYLEFMEFEKYVFIYLNDSKRLERVKNYVQRFIHFPIEIKTLEEIQFLYPELGHLGIKENENYLKIVELESSIIFENGYNAFKSGMYPNDITKGLLKHIKVDNLRIFDAENKGMYLYCAINAAIYVNDSKLESFESPLIVKKYEEINSEDFEVLKFSDILKSFELFTKLGKVNISKNIVDYGILMGLSKFNSLVFVDGYFYLDFSKTIKIGISGDNYKSLFNRATLYISDSNVHNRYAYSSGLKEIFPFLIHINKHYSNLRFTTIHNKNKLDVIVTSSEYSYWIGFNNDSEYFVMNVGNLRLFKVNSRFMDYFEYVIKKQSDLQVDKYQKEIRDLLDSHGK